MSKTWADLLREAADAIEKTPPATHAGPSPGGSTRAQQLQNHPGPSRAVTLARDAVDIVTYLAP